MINKKGQSLLEYGLILGIVTVALVTMQAYFKRGIQSVIKVVADDYGPQATPISDAEIATKKQIYEKEGKVLIDSKSAGSWKKKIENKGEGRIATNISGSNTVTTDSVFIGADYKTRDIAKQTNAPPTVDNP